MKESPNGPGLLVIAGEALGVAGLIVVMAYAVPLGLELMQL
ncbi:hypothetical protein [Pseudomonas sp. RIT-PI-S]|nr:hypothetical protein [Pseudomonas sp. RIT-PI-S]